MKRIVLLFLAIAFVAVTGFAQEIKFSGYVNSGVGVEFSSRDGEEDPMIRVFGVDSEQRGGRFRLNGSYVNEGKTIGVDLRFQLQGVNTVNNSADVGLVFGYGWIKPVDMLLIKAGLVGDTTFETQGPILRDDAGGGAGAGLFVKLTPIDGFDIGVGVYPLSADGSNNNHRIQAIATNQKWYDVKYTFGLAYTMPEVFKINTSFRTSNDAGVASRSQARGIAEFQLLMVEDMTAILELEIERIFNKADEFDMFKDTGKINIFETFAYKINDLRFGLNAAQYISKDDNFDDIGLRFNPWVSYAFAEGKIVPRLDGVFFMGGDRWRTGHPGTYSTGDPSDIEKFDRRMDVAPTYNWDEYVISARPSVKINIDSRNFLEIGNAFYYRKQANVDGFINNVFYIDLVTRF